MKRANIFDDDDEMPSCSNRRKRRLVSSDSEDEDAIEPCTAAKLNRNKSGIPRPSGSERSANTQTQQRVSELVSKILRKRFFFEFLR